jgi:hypothetical protein
MRRICCGYCARAASGHAAAPPMSVMNSRRFTAEYLPCSEQRIAQHCCAAGFQFGLCRLWIKFRHCSDVRCTTAFPPKAEVRRDLGTSQTCQNRTRAVQQSNCSVEIVYSITSSASSCKESRTVRPRAFAVAKLITISNLIGDWTGRSATFSPRKMRSTYAPVRRKISDGSGPYDIRLPSNTNCR